MKTLNFKTSEAVASHCGAMEADTILKHGRSSKSQMSRRNMRISLLMLFSIIGISLFGQVTNKNEVSTEMLSNISEIVECDAKMLGLIFSTGFETISKYMEVSWNIDKTQNLADFFSNITRARNLYYHSVPGFSNLNMTVEELIVEIVERIDVYLSTFNRIDINKGLITVNVAKRMTNVCLQDVENLIPEYEKVEKALLENEKVILLIPPDYRYPLALSTMLGFVRNFRASTWKECVDLYEEQYHRWVMEENSRENIRIQSEIRNLSGQIASDTRKIKRNTAATAIFSGLTFFSL